MIFKNVIDTRLHKEEMKLYRAFEALFFNSRDRVKDSILKDDSDLSDQDQD